MTQYFASDPTELGLSVSAMVWRDREILLMRRSDNGHWGLPGGFVELASPGSPQGSILLAGMTFDVRGVVLACGRARSRPRWLHRGLQSP